MAAFLNVGKELLRSEEVTGKMLLVLAYLRIFASFINEVRISVMWLVQDIGYRPKSGRGNINDQIRSILQLLKERGAVQFDAPGSTTQQIKIRLNVEHPYFNPQGGYVQITSDELDKIVSCNYLRKDWLMAVYLIVKSHMYYNPRDQNYDAAYPTLRTITNEVSALVQISHNSVSKVLSILVEIGLLRTYSVGSYIVVRDGKETLQAFPNFYTVGNQTIDPEKCIKLAKERLRSRGIDVDKFIRQ